MARHPLRETGTMEKHILLCDDEPHIMRAAQFKLERSGFTVHCACDGEDAWEQIAERTPDLLITDCQMPRLDGIGLAARIRSQESLSDLPIIMLTAKGFELSQEELREQLGIHSVIAKPFSPKELVQVAATTIETRTPVRSPA